MSELHDLTALEQAAALRAGEVSSLELTDHYLARIDKLSDSVGKVVEDGLNDLISIATRFVDAVGNVRDIAGQVGDHTKLPGGRWPEAVRG